MKKNWAIYAAVFAFTMLILILDAKTAIKGAQEGISVCLYTVIPALFPLLYLSVLINSSVTGNSIKILRPLGKICGIPQGAESILLLGLIGGYPVGAQCIYQAYNTGQITKSEAKRMLGFCNNAGPAFIFGMSTGLFVNPAKSWLLWGIHIISALIVGIVLSNSRINSKITIPKKSISASEALNIAGHTMLSICGWIILFRVVISVISRWLTSIGTTELLTVITGLLELSNGCIAAASISDESLRFIYTSGMLALGGCCVFMQTIAATKELGVGFYLHGKVLQCMICILLSLILTTKLNNYYFPIYAVLISAIVFLVTYLRKKTVAFQDKVVYNQ